MNYYKSDIVLQEVPNEISLCISICGCPLRCAGCHSPFLWKEALGSELNAEILTGMIDRYKELITCVIFMGGEWHLQELIRLMDLCKSHRLKTCLYSGKEYVNIALLKRLDYLKTGPWISDRGGLDAVTTNQVFREVATGRILNHLFQKKRNYDQTDRRAD